MRIAFGTDEDNAVTEHLVSGLREAGHDVAHVAAGGAWPEVGRAVGQAVASGRAERGVVCCHTGTGVSIAANKIRGVRAALCRDPATAAGARRWNDANVLALGLAGLEEAVADQVVACFLATGVDDGEETVIARVESAEDPGPVG